MSAVNCPICSTLEAKIVEQLMASLALKTFKRNEAIYNLGEDSLGLFLISKGSVKLSKNTLQGKEVVMQILQEGQTFGEAGVLGQPKNLETATASTNSQIFFFPREKLVTLCESHPTLFHSLLSSLFHSLSQLHQVIENIGLHSAKEKVWSYLCQLSPEPNSRIVRLSAKKHEVALLLGLRPETLSRTLSEIEELGFIKMNHKQIELLRPHTDFPI